MKRKLLTFFILIISYMLISFICISEVFAVEQKVNEPTNNTSNTDNTSNSDNTTNEKESDDTKTDNDKSQNTDNNTTDNTKEKDEVKTPKKTTTKSSEARLNDLGIKPKSYDFSGFKKDNTSYKTTVPNDVKEVEIYATPTDSKAKVKGTGKVELKEGVNEAKIVVTAEDGKTTKTYVIKITREAKQEEKQEDQKVETSEKKEQQVLGLSKLSINDIELTPKFNSNTYEYKTDLTKDLDKLELDLEANDANATIEIIGNENLQQGENIITILLTNAKKEEFATYQIIVNKNVNENEGVAGVNWKDPSTWRLKEQIIVGAIGAIALIIIILIIRKIKFSKKDYDDLDLPGAEELDRALTEHQEMTKHNDEKSDIEKAQEYFEEYSRRKGRHF